ncbi:hypothetical protein WJX79_007000 [Trebouxia sp. C0005]
MLRRHLPLLKATGYQAAKVEACQEVHKLFGPRAGRMTAKVTLKPKFEPAEGNNIPQHLIDEFEEKRAGMGHLKYAETAVTRKDEGKSNLDRQGHWIPLQSKATPALLHEPHLDKLISINSMDVVNPDHDIPAQGICNIRLEPSVPNKSPQIARVYFASGKACGTLNIERLWLLHQAFSHTQAHNADIHAKYNNPSFEQAVLKLLTRYKPGKVKDTNNRKLTKDWSTPNKFMKALAEGLSLDTERFASPLNFSAHYTKYYSLSEEDQLFGANHNAYATKWTGPHKQPQKLHLQQQTRP